MPSPTELQQQVTLGFKWAEFISRSPGATQQGSFGWGSPSQTSLVWDVRWQDFVGPGPAGDSKALREILGFSQMIVNNAGVKKIFRKTPVVHPMFPHMRAVRMQYQPVGYTGKVVDVFGPYAAYDRCRVVVTFEALPYRVLADNELANLYAGQEWYRYVILERMPSVDSIQRKGDAFRWAQTSAAGVDYGQGPTLNQPINFNVAHLIPKAELKLTWVQVPENYIFNSSLVATNIESALGKLNSSTFMGYAAGTLLLVGIRYVPIPAPFSMPDIPLWGPHRLWNVELAIKFFSPPTFTGATVAGHNLLPFSGNNLWYLVKAVKTANAIPPDGRTLYETTDFANIFTGVS